MESPPRLELVFVLLVTFSSAFAVPLSRNEGCARHCTESRRFHFKPGTTYTYDYETSTTTLVKGTSKDQSQLQLRAQVDIEVVSKCDFSLRLRGVSLKQADVERPDYLNPIRNGREFSRSVEQHILRFSWQDGKVEHLCPSETTPTWVTNIHRGVLSALQNSMESLDKDERVIETDVAGKCPVEYHSLGKSWRGVLRIRKMKELNSCTDRHSANTALQAIPFSHDSAIQSQPLVSGFQECEQSVGEGIVQTSSCTEKHVFRPFSKGSGGVTTTVHQQLSFSTTSKRSFTGNDYRPTREGLLFKHEEPTATDADQVEMIMKQLCDASQNEITISVPEKFASLVYKLRTLDYRSLSDFFRRVDTMCPNNHKAKKFFMDAVPIISTAASVRFMAEMIKRQEISDSEADFWFTSLSFVTEPTAEMIGYLTPLIDGRYEQALLGVSALVHAFCKDNHCSSVPEVRDLVHRLVENLGETCFNPETKKILLTLKAIGNIGQPFGREKILERCYQNPQLKMEVRLAAIQTFRRFSCDVSRDMFLKTYNNYDEDTEIRIASYLATTTCLTSETLQEIKETLERERVNQVGSFVWTHLQALAKSRHPERQEIKQIVSNIYLLNKYHPDARKFSSAREASLYLDSINSGFHLDSHLVFPTHSFLPHSASLNLTVDIFGHSCNLFQLDGRMEGMEHIMERFFGPNGYFPQKHVSKLLRQRRSISENKIDRMDAQFDAKAKFEEKPYGSLDVKIFGNTLWYSQFEENENSQSETNLMDLIAELAHKQEKEFSRSFMFLDTTYTIPVASGLPLRLAVNGTANVNLKLGGRFNVRSMQNVDILAHIEPSGAIHLAGLLTIEAGNAARTGMRVAATLHSSTVMDTKLEVRNGEMVKAEINVPREKIDVIDIQTRLYLVYGNDEREPQGQYEDGFRVNSCTPNDSIKRILGVELCADVRLPGGKGNTPIYPMNGPSTVSLYLKKTDPTLTKYTFDATWENKMINGKFVRQGFISLNTPQSTVDREFKMHYNLNQPDGTLSIEAKTPVKKMGLTAKYVNTTPLKKLDLTISIDDKSKFSIRSEFQTKTDKGGVSYFPSFEVNIPSRRLVNIDGSVHLKYGQKYGGQIIVQDLTEKPITLKGNFDFKEKNRYEGEVSISSYPLDATVKGYGQAGDTMFTKITADYKIMDGKSYKVSVNGKVRDLSAHSLKKYTGVLNLQATAIPEWDTSVSWEAMQTTGHLENTFSFTIGDAVKTRVHTITLQEIVKYRGNLHDNNIEATFKLEYPQKNIKYALQMKHENTDRSLRNFMEIQYAINRHVTTAVELSYEPGKSFNGVTSLKYPGRDARMTIELMGDNPNDYKILTNIQWQQGKMASFMGHYRDRSDNSRSKYETEFEVKLPSIAPITVSGSIGALRDQYSGFAEVIYDNNKYRLNTDFVNGQNFDHRMVLTLLVPGETYSLEESLQSSRDKVTGIAEIKLSNRRRISTRFEVKNSKSLKTSYFETSWDADRDPTKKFALNGEMRTNPTGCDVKFTVQVQRRNIRGTLSSSMEGEINGDFFKSIQKAEVEWAPRKKVGIFFNTNTVTGVRRKQISSTLEVTTPYYDYEKMSLSFNHAFVPQEWNTDLTATWGQNQKLGFSTEGKYSLTQDNDAFLETNVKVVNPWTDYETLSFNISHYHNSHQFLNNMQCQWNSRGKISTEISGFTSDNGFKGKIKLMTPFINAHDMHIEVNHNFASGIHKTKFDVQWANDKKINAELDLKHLMTGHRRVCSVTFTASSPFKDFERVSSKMAYNNDGNGLNADGEIHWGRYRKITMGFMQTNRNSIYNKNIQMKTYFTSPFNGYKGLEISSSLQTTSELYKFNINSKLPHEMSVSFDSEAKFVSWQNLEFNAVVNGHFNNKINFKKLSIDLVHKNQDNNIRSSFDGVYNDEKIIVLLTGSMEPGYNSENIEGTLLAKTPFTGYEEMNINFKHNRKELKWTTKVEAKRNRQILSLIHNADINTLNINFNTDTTLTVTSHNLRQTVYKYTASHVQTPDYLSHESVVEWGPKKMELKAKYEDKMSGNEMEIKMSSPFQTLRNFNLFVEHQATRNEFKTRVTTHLNSDQKLFYQSRITNYMYKKVDAEFNVSTNFYTTQASRLSVKYDISNPTKTFELYNWHQGSDKNVNIRGSFLPSTESPEFRLEATTPFSNFEKISIKSTALNLNEKKKLSFSYENNREKTEMNTEIIMRRNMGNGYFTFTAPFADFMMSANYEKGQGFNFNGETKVQWMKSKEVKFMCKSLNKDKTFDVKVSLNTPFNNYRDMSLDVSTDLSSPKYTSTIILRKNADKIETVLTCQVQKGREGHFKILFTSPFRGMENINVESNYKKDWNKFNSNIKFDAGSQRIYTGDIQYNNNKEMQEVITTVRTPHYPYKNMEFSAKFKNNKYHQKFESNARIENKDMDILLEHKMSGQNMHEIKLVANSPFEALRKVDILGSLHYPQSGEMNCNLEVSTSIPSLNKITFSTQYKADNEFYDIKIDGSIPKKTLTISGQLTRNLRKPVQGSLNLDAPFMEINNVALKAKIDHTKGWSDASAEFEFITSRSPHALVANIRLNDADFSAKLTAQSHLLRGNNMNLMIRANYQDARSVNAEIVCNIFNERHTLEAKYGQNRHESMLEAKLICPFLPEKKLGFKASYTQRRKTIESRIAVELPSGEHSLFVKGEMDNTKATALLTMNSNLLPSSTMEIKGSYINAYGRDIEISLLSETPREKHSITVNLKNYVGDKLIQVEINCPWLPIKEFSMTGTLKDSNYNAMDGAFIINAEGKELRIATNMKRMGWNDMEAFLILNTPFERLSMLRLDTAFKNKDAKNIEINFKMDARTNRNVRNMGFTAKLTRSTGSEDFSLNLHLPYHNPSTQPIQFLASVHYEPDMKTADSRIDLVISSYQYSASGSYQVQNNGISVDYELEYDGKKYAFSCQGKVREDMKGLSGKISLPGVGPYTAGISTSSSDTRHSLSVSYGSPYQNLLNISINMNYISVSHLDVGLIAETPFKDYNRVHARVRYQRESIRHLSLEAECSVNEKKSVINVFHRVDHANYLSSVRIGTPFEKLRDFEVSYVKRGNREGSIDITYNNNRYLKGELATIKDAQSIILDMPRMPMTISAKLKSLKSSYELSIKSSYPTRTMSFNLLGQESRESWMQEATLTWDEASKRHISYNVKITDTIKNRNYAKELFASINFPLRSLELKGKFARSGKVKSGGIDFYWDASRDPTKHVAIGVEHQDLSSRVDTSRRLQITLIHPTLPKDLELTNVFTLSDTEFLYRSELQYSRQQDRHLIMEFKAINMQPRQANTHYRAELSLRHPISKLFVKATGEISNSRSDAMAEFKFNNMNRRQQTTLHEIKATISKVNQRFDILMKDNNNEMKFTGRKIDRNGESTYVLQQTIGNELALQGNLRLDHALSAMDLNISYADTKGMQLSGSYEEDEITMRLGHFNDVGTYTDISAYVGLERSRILRSKLTWKPGVWRDMRIATGDNLRGLTYSAAKTFEVVAQEMKEEYQHNVEEVKTELARQLQAFLSSLSRDVESIRNDFITTANTLKKMYANNEFFSKDIVLGVYATGKAMKNFVEIVEVVTQFVADLIVNTFQEALENLYYDLEDFAVFMRDTFRNSMESYKKIMKIISINLRKCSEYISSALCDYMVVVRERVGNMMEQTINYLDASVRKHAPFIIDTYYYMKMASDRIRNGLNDAANSVTQMIVNNPFYMALSEYFERVITTIRTFQTADFVSTLQSRVLFLGQQANTFFNQLSDVQVVNIIRDRIPVDYIMDSAKVTLQKGAELYSTLGVDRLVKGVFNYAVTHFKAILLTSGQDLLNEFYQLKTGAKYDFDFKRGSLAFEYTLPTSKNSIYEVFQLAEYPEYRKLSELKDALITKYYEDFCIWDIYYKIKNFFSPKYWMPPFSAHAMTAGNQHYITFDKLAFDFAGECSYLLARDFVDGNFTVVANYKRENGKPVRKSLTIHLDGSKFELVNDYRLTYDGVKVEMPIRVGRTVIKREGPNVRIENDRKGFVIACNFALDVCTVGMSGFYFGKTGGLFGTYDYEPNLDMMTPQRSLTTDVETFVNSWEVGHTTCRSSENLASKPANSYSAQKKCESIFAETSSPFRACFKQVSPEPYLTMCLNDLGNVPEHKYESVLCTSAAAYFTECKIENVQLKMPSSCVKCETTGAKPMMEGDSIKFTKENPTHAADVVFVVEKKKCNEENVKYLTRLAHSIEDNFRQKGFMDIRYRVVGFGGEDIHANPHIHTMDGQEYGNIRSLDSAFNSFQFGDGPVNMLEALRFAASLNFRPGTSKTFILIKCSACKSEESRAEYGEMLRTLQDGDINLHLLMEQKYEMRIANKNSKAKKVIGLDKNFAYTLKDVKDSNVFGDGDLLVQLKVPKDICIPLALEVNGSTFDSQYLTETKRSTYKKFMDVFARRMVKSATHVPSGGSLCCECIATEDGIGKSTCQKCVSAEVAQMIPVDSSEDYTSRSV